MPIISSQRFLDDAIVAEKQREQDYVVTLYTVELGGKEYDVVIDGHHSLAAALADGADPEFEDVEPAIAAEYEYEIDKVGVRGWLEHHWNDAPYYDVYTGIEVDFPMESNGSPDIETDLTVEQAQAILEPYFLVVRDRFLEAGFDRLKRVRLSSRRRIHDTPRHFAACYEDGSEIVVAPELAELGYDTVCAMLAHELGHATDFNYPAEFVLRDDGGVRRVDPGNLDDVTDAKHWRHRLNGWKRRDGDVVEITADGIAEAVMGVPIGYRGPCLLQAFGGEPRPLGLR